MRAHMQTEKAQYFAVDVESVHFKMKREDRTARSVTQAHLASSSLFTHFFIRLC
jgi:hypothetical protein